MATGFALMRLGRVATSDAGAEAATRASGQQRTRTHFHREPQDKPKPEPRADSPRRPASPVAGGRIRTAAAGTGDAGSDHAMSSSVSSSADTPPQSSLREIVGGVASDARVVKEHT